MEMTLCEREKFISSIDLTMFWTMRSKSNELDASDLVRTDRHGLSSATRTRTPGFHEELSRDESKRAQAAARPAQYIALDRPAIACILSQNSTAAHGKKKKKTDRLMQFFVIRIVGISNGFDVWCVTVTKRWMPTIAL